MTEDLRQLIATLHSLERAAKDVLIYSAPAPHVSVLVLNMALIRAQSLRHDLQRRRPELRRM